MAFLLRFPKAPVVWPPPLKLKVSRESQTCQKTARLPPARPQIIGTYAPPACAFSEAWGSYRNPREEGRLFHRPRGSPYDEPPTGYSSAGCSPAGPASASPAGSHSEAVRRPLSIAAKNPLDTASPFQRCASRRLLLDLRELSVQLLERYVTIKAVAAFRVKVKPGCRRKPITADHLFSLQTNEAMPMSLLGSL